MPTVNHQNAFVQLFLEKYKDKVWAIVFDKSNMKTHVIGHDRKLIDSWVFYPTNKTIPESHTFEFTTHNTITQIIPEHLDQILSFVKVEN